MEINPDMRGLSKTSGLEEGASALRSLNNPGFFTLHDRVSSSVAVVHGWAPKEEGPIEVIERPPGLGHVQQRPMFFSDHFWFCCQCAAEGHWSSNRQVKHRLHYGECSICSHHACPDCAVGFSPNPPDMLHTLSGINISRQLLIGVTWLCPNSDCREFAKNRLDETPPPKRELDGDISDLQGPSGAFLGAFFDPTPVQSHCCGDVCMQNENILEDIGARTYLKSNSLVLNSQGKVLGSWDGRQAINGGPWAQHLRALQEGHTVLRQFLVAAGRGMPEISHPSVGMKMPAPAPVTALSLIPNLEGYMALMTPPSRPMPRAMSKVASSADLLAGYQKDLEKGRR